MERKSVKMYELNDWLMSHLTHLDFKNLNQNPREILGISEKTWHNYRFGKTAMSVGQRTMLSNYLSNLGYSPKSILKL